MNNSVKEDDLIKAVEAGDVKAMVQLGEMYSAQAHYTERAHIGEREDIKSVMRQIRNGDGDAELNAKAFYWFKKAADAGNEFAIMRVAQSLYDGVGVEKNRVKSLEYYLKAANNGSTRAMNIVARIYSNGIKQDEQELAPDKEKAFQWYLKSAELGDSNGIREIVKMFVSGRDIEQNFDKMNEWLGKLNNQDFQEVTFNIANRYLAKYPKEQFAMFKRSADAGYIPAFIEISDYYCNGSDEIKQDYGKALDTLKKAANMPIDDDKVEKNARLRKASHNPHYLSHRLLAMTKIGDMYYVGDGAEQNYETAFEWYKKAADGGFNSAIIQLGRMYYYGKGVTQNYTEAFRWFMQAANEREKFAFVSRYNTVARTYIAMMYENGYGVEKNLGEALKWYTLAAEDTRNTFALENLAGFYYLGKGTEVNYESALEYYEKAAENYSYLAMRKLITMYELGEGVEKNIDKANEWRKKINKANFI